jgi:hypothetical protein
MSYYKNLQITAMKSFTTLAPDEVEAEVCHQECLAKTKFLFWLSFWPTLSFWPKPNSD